MSLLFNKIFASIAWSHFIIDVLNGQRFVLLAYLSGPLGLTNTLIGAISTAYQVLMALAQPLFGYLTDRVGPRWSVAGGVLWMGAFITLAAVIPGRAALVFLVLASLGSGAFHPAGAAEATLQGRQLLSGRETTRRHFSLCLASWATSLAHWRAARCWIFSARWAWW
jgi:FSR family fosmidomycin resistance protein-like MFS transporter